METKTFLAKIKSKKILFPEVRRNPLTFLGISKQPHYEDVWSNIYAFFLDVNAEHGFKDLFISSLLKVIRDSGVIFEFDNNFEIAREYPTKENGRIDLVLQSSSKAIIVENKVYHFLNNNLEDYWQSIDSPNKVGVVLTLHKLAHVPHVNFINITHHQLLDSVMQWLGNYIVQASSKYVTFLTDFYQNILNLSNPMDYQNIDLFYNYNNEIKKVNELSENVKQHIKSETNTAGEILGLNVLAPRGKQENEFRYYLSHSDHNLMFTVIFKGLFSSKKQLMVIVELQNALLKNKEIFESIKFSETENSLIKDDFYSNSNNWAHFALDTFSPANGHEIQNLSEFISEKINNSPLKTIFHKLEEAISQQISK
ncbi:PD-(D/E)XK nuclease family protein [Marinilabilia sp.]|uniref:PD-(D/E)XK nuclease family protein n=1 Tax=Marinilabilia sp. TaxID=2021252 RepID=UPI0025C1D429|nr:PD-(D/E)XK nuclease family protein [Marinilabilia sp.]